MIACTGVPNFPIEEAITIHDKSYGQFRASLLPTPENPVDMFAESVRHVISGLVDHDAYLSAAQRATPLNAHYDLDIRIARSIEFDANPVGELILTSPNLTEFGHRWNGFNQVAPLGVQRLISNQPKNRRFSGERSGDACDELRTLVALTFVEQVSRSLAKPTRSVDGNRLLADYRRLGLNNAAVEDCMHHVYANPATTLTAVTTTLWCGRRTMQRELTRSKLTFQVLRRAVQITVASRLLRESVSSLTEITHLAGFYDSAHFCHAWKQSCGVSPSQYRAIAMGPCRRLA